MPTIITFSILITNFGKFRRPQNKKKHFVIKKYSLKFQVFLIELFFSFVFRKMFQPNEVYIVAINSPNSSFKIISLTFFSQRERIGLYSTAKKFQPPEKNLFLKYKLDGKFDEQKITKQSS